MMKTRDIPRPLRDIPMLVSQRIGPLRAGDVKRSRMDVVCTWLKLLNIDPNDTKSVELLHYTSDGAYEIRTVKYPPRHDGRRPKRFEKYTVIRSVGVVDLAPDWIEHKYRSGM